MFFCIKNLRIHLNPPESTWIHLGFMPESTYGMIVNSQHCKLLQNLNLFFYLFRFVFFRFSLRLIEMHFRALSSHPDTSVRILSWHSWILDVFTQSLKMRGFAWTLKFLESFRCQLGRLPPCRSQGQLWWVIWKVTNGGLYNELRGFPLLRGSPLIWFSKLRGFPLFFSWITFKITGNSLNLGYSVFSSCFYTFSKLRGFPLIRFFRLRGSPLIWFQNYGDFP